MVVRANKKFPELGGHSGTFASAATLYDVGMNHFWRAKNNKFGGDLIYFQGHSAPGMYARAFLEGRLSEKQLDKKDFYPFKLSSAKLAMTAHVLYSKIDSENVATFSNKIINGIIRKKIGFKGILISDDISMKALKYDIATNAKKIITSRM